MDSASGRIKLTDFGLAASADFTGDPNGIGKVLFDAEHITGTPSFMAPEQIRNTWRDYGPDGLVCGRRNGGGHGHRAPAVRGKMGEVFNQHLTGVLPYSIRLPMPVVFVEWIEAMMGLTLIIASVEQQMLLGR